MVRSITAWSGILLAILWTLLGAFLLDWLFEMSRGQRIVLWGLMLVTLAWAFRRYALPWLGQRENEVDLALMVERQQQIDSDLVAALQFERPEARQWGSAQLETAVIDYVADFSRDLHVFEGFSPQPAQRRATLLGTTLLLGVILVLLFPAHWSAFVNRLLLGNAHYPTRTMLEEIVINGTSVSPLAPGETAVACPYGQPVTIQVRCRGELPSEGRAVLRSFDGAGQTELLLARADADDTFQGELPRLIDSVQYQLYLGDAWTDPGEIRLVPLPVVSINLTPTPPPYASAAVRDAQDEQPGARLISVIEGSQVELAVACHNKSLQEVVLTIGEESWPLETRGSEGREWTLPHRNSPLAMVTGPMRYSLQVVDVDGLSLESPIEGDIRIRTDRPPRITASIISRHVLPTAQPRISFSAADDFGLSRLTAQVQITRHQGETETRTVEICTFGTADQPVNALRETYALDLAPFELQKGDEVEIALEAFDYRGELPPKSSLSERLTVEVTDREGILATLLEADEKSARQLDAIIRRELGIGEAK